MLAAADSTAAGATGTDGEEVFTGEAPVSATALVRDLTTEQKVAVQSALWALTETDLSLAGSSSRLGVQRLDGTITFAETPPDQVAALVLEFMPPSGKPVSEVRSRVASKIEATGTGARFEGLWYPPEAVTEPGAPPKKDIPPEREFNPEAQKVSGWPTMGWFGWSMVIGGGAIAVGLIGYAVYKGTR